MTHIYELPDAPECPDNLPHGVWTWTGVLVPIAPTNAVLRLVIVPLCHDGSEDY